MKFIINDESQGSVCTDYNEYSFTLNVVEKALAQFVSWESQFSMRENQGIKTFELPDLVVPDGICDSDAYNTLVDELESYRHLGSIDSDCDNMYADMSYDYTMDMDIDYDDINRRRLQYGDNKTDSSAGADSASLNNSSADDAKLIVPNHQRKLYYEFSAADLLTPP